MEKEQIQPHDDIDGFCLQPYWSRRWSGAIEGDHLGCSAKQHPALTCAMLEGYASRYITSGYLHCLYRSCLHLTLRKRYILLF